MTGDYRPGTAGTGIGTKVFSTGPGPGEGTADRMGRPGTAGTASGMMGLGDGTAG